MAEKTMITDEPKLPAVEAETVSWSAGDKVEKKPRQPTILELIHRLRWDNRLDPSEYSLGYWDRVARKIIEVSLSNADWEASDHFALCLKGDDGRRRIVPLHRVRRVWKGAEIVWQREGPEGALREGRGS